MALSLILECAPGQAAPYQWPLAGGGGGTVQYAKSSIQLIDWRRKWLIYTSSRRNSGAVGTAMPEAQQRVAPTYSRRSRSAIFAGPLLVALSLVLVVAGGWYTDVRRPLPNPLQPVEGLQWWFTPVERNAFMRLPVVTGNLYAVDASDDGQVIWAVGENALIVGTTDGGKTWREGKAVLDAADSEAGERKPKPAAAERRPAAAAFNMLDAFNPVAVARAVEVRKQDENAPAPNEPAYDSRKQLAKEADTSNAIQQSNGSAAVAAPPRVKVDLIAPPEPARSKLKPQQPTQIDQSQVQQQAPEVMEQDTATRNVWSERDRVLNPTLHGVAVIDARRAIAVGANGVVLLTQDGGATWTQQALQAAGNSPSYSADLLSVAFASDSEGIAVGERGTVLRTEDGGITWRYEPLKSSGTLRSVAAADAQNWAIVGQDGLIVTSSDGGRSWNFQRSPIDSTLVSVAFADALNAVACSAAQVLTSTDGGKTWAVDAGFERTSQAQLQEVGIGSGRIIAMDSGGLAYKKDGIWSRQILKAGGNRSLRLKFAANGSVFVTGENGLLIQSSDFGQGWKPLTAYAGIFRHVFTYQNRGVILGYSGVAPADADSYAQRMLTSSDAGMTWAVDFETAMFADVEVQNESVPRSAAATNRVPEWAMDKPAPPPTFKMPPDFSASAIADSRIGLAVTDRLSRSENGGNSWPAVTVPTPAPVVDVAFAGSQRAIALAQGRVLVSNDAGKTFESVRYKRYPSPWLWMACAMLLAFAALLLRRSLRKPEVEQQPSSITDAAASDRPIEWGDPDPAGLRDIALGLSRFLRNRRTEPPLTIAVTGEWGTGKSSLMNLLRHDLMRYGYKPVWFNAWHHQSGENLLGSLLANIHAQGVPPLHTVAGLDFRLTLLAIRSRRFWWRLTLTLFVIVVVFFSYDKLGARAAELWTTLTVDSWNGVPGGISNIGAATELLGIIVAVLTPIVGAVRAASAFGLQPAKLIAAVATTRHDESARIQAGARYRFAREFGDFTRALDPRPLVIFIDDLDRCRAENVIEVLEAVNFLISSGRCIVVIGMARRWVETCVGLAFKELAAAHIDKRDDETTDYDPLNTPADAATEQQLFAKHYLEKLINVEIRVPRLSDSAAGAILQGSEFATPSNHLRYGLGTALLRTAAAVVSIAIVAGVIVLGKSTADWLAALDSKAFSSPQTLTQPTTDAPAQQSASLDPESQSPLQEDRPVVFDAPDARTSMSWYFNTGTSVTLALAAFLAVAMFARKESRTDDSPAFREALSLLQPWIMVGGSSPRSLKRFINHVRYIAMRFRPGADIPTTYEKFTNRMRVWFGRAPIDTGNSGVPQRLQLSEELLVALATLHRCNESWLDELFIARERDLALLLVRDIGPQIDDPDERQAVLKRLRESIDKFNERFSDSELFENEMLDRRHAIAFYEVMAFETGVREQATPEEAAPPRPLRQA